MIGTIVLVVVILLLLGALPTWPHSRRWGYYPNGRIWQVTEPREEAQNLLKLLKIDSPKPIAGHA